MRGWTEQYWVGGPLLGNVPDTLLHLREKTLILGISTAVSAWVADTVAKTVGPVFCGLGLIPLW